MERGVQQRRKTPSFSSSLLDSVLRSIDESSDEGQQLLMSKKQGGAAEEEEEEIASARRAVMIEKWMRKQSAWLLLFGVEFRRDLLVFGGREQQRREILLHSAQIEVCSGGCFRRIGEVGEGCGLGGAERFDAERRQLHEDEIESSDNMIN